MDSSAGNHWWHADTLRTWAQAAFDDELVPEDQFRERLGCDAEKWTQMSSPAPEPFLSNPDRWWSTQVNQWTSERGHALRADLEVVFVRDVPWARRYFCP
ncbi:Uncharacterised protein [Mycobacteroides abscessus subsp. abscessus]|nr:Uncharacterised protein [Mycobacteroides abscessus subsp. abscessus]